MAWGIVGADIGESGTEFTAGGLTETNQIAEWLNIENGHALHSALARGTADAEHVLVQGNAWPAAWRAEMERAMVGLG